MKRRSHGKDGCDGRSQRTAEGSCMEGALACRCSLCRYCLCNGACLGACCVPQCVCVSSTVSTKFHVPYDPEDNVNFRLVQWGPTQ